MGGLSFDKLLVIAGIAIILIGPQRLPMYAERLGQLVRNLRRYADGARDKMREEMGPEVFDDIDWQKLDPRQYDPRRIIRDALLDDSEPIVSAPESSDPSDAATTQVVGLASVATKPSRLEAGGLPPFDVEAT